MESLTDKKAFISELNTLGKDRKWLLDCACYLSIEFFDIMLGIQKVGMGFKRKHNSYSDYSFFIYPNFRKKGYARKFINHCISKSESVQFTVSISNNAALNLFSNHAGLHPIEVEKQVGYCIFRKKPDFNMIN